MECNEKLWNICDFGNNRKAWNLSGIMEHVENYGIRKKIIEHQLKDPALLVKKNGKIFLKKSLKKKFDFFYPVTRVSTKNFSPISPVFWPVIRNIYIYECLVLLHR